MGAEIAKYYTVLGNLSWQGFFGPVPEELRTVPIFLGVFALLFGLPFLMRKAGKWRAVLIAFPAYWLATALLATWAVQQPKRLPEGVTAPLMLFIFIYYSLGLAAIIYNKGYRLATVGLVVANVYIATFTVFISGMAMTGNWI